MSNYNKIKDYSLEKKVCLFHILFGIVDDRSRIFFVHNISRVVVPKIPVIERVSYQSVVADHGRRRVPFVIRIQRGRPPFPLSVRNIEDAQVCKYAKNSTANIINRNRLTSTSG